MHRPILVTPPAELPVTVALAREHCLIDGTDFDTYLEALIGAAVAHLDGYSGILGRCIVSQTWKQEFDAFGRTLRLPLLALEAVAVTSTNTAGQIATVNQANYTLQHDERGSLVRFKDSFEIPGDLYQTKAVSVSFTAGFGGAADVPLAIKHAILMMVAHWFAHREAVTDVALSLVPIGAMAMLVPFRRVGI
jgi:uncharacterized phiE125 gp8 family phage protein